MNTDTIVIGGTEVEVRRKHIKNLHIGVYPPNGHVRVAAPMATAPDAIRLAVLTRMAWIRRKQARFANQERQSPRRYVSGETHFLFGRPRRLEVVEWDKKVRAISTVGVDRLVLKVPHGANELQRRKWIENWFKAQLRRAAEPRIEFWAKRLGVEPKKWGIRPMKTKWGSCNPQKRSIWLNAELSRKPENAIDYIVVHELAHLVSPRHDNLFVAVMDDQLPNWRMLQSELNSYPLPAWRQ